MKQMTAQTVQQLIARRLPCELIGAVDLLVGPAVVRSSQDAEPGALFVAIAGERFDGHDFAADAVQGGAVCLLVNRQLAIDVPQLVVADTQLGLSALAAGIVEDQIAAGALTALALTGSSGKTSTKDLLAQIVATAGPTVAPQGSYNNEIGVPLTACRVDDQTQFLVSEMGARSVGDVAALCEIVPPQISAVLNIGVAHLGEFGDRETIALAKGEIFDALPADGWAVLNAQDDFYGTLRERVERGSKARIACWAVEPELLPTAQLVVVAQDLVADEMDRYGFTLTASTPEQSQSARVQLPLISRVQVLNALAASTMAIAAGVPFQQIVHALQTATNRSEWRMAADTIELADGQAVVINDAYNANPGSMRAALETLASIATKQRAQGIGTRSIAVLGDMLELGADAAQIHCDLGAQAADLGIDEVLAVGEFAADIVAGCKARRPDLTAHAVAKAEVVDALPLRAGDVVLAKASRGIGLEAVVAQMLARYGESDESRPAQAADSSHARQDGDVDASPAAAITEDDGEDPAA